MLRDVSRLSQTRFDLLIIGGGIHGLFAAREAAMRGLRVALVEAADYGSGLSFNHQRTVHGGLRSLQHGQVVKARAQIAERRRWALMAPAHLRPLPFVVGAYAGTPRTAFRLTMGLRLYDLVGRDRNKGLPAALHLPASRVVNRADAIQAYPQLPTEGLTGAAIWHDYQVVRPDRLNWLVARAAMDVGAQLVNYAAAVAPVRAGARIVGARVRDVATGQVVHVEASMTLMCAGAGLPNLFSSFKLDDQAPPLVAAANILLAHPSIGAAVAAPGPSGRMLTAVPWGGGTLVGTFQGSTFSTSSDAFPLAVEQMLAEANSAFPSLNARPADVRLVHRGLTPGTTVAGSADLLPEPRLIDHRQRGVAGAISLVGVKFTMARQAARAAVRLASQALDITFDDAMHTALPLPAAAIVTPEALFNSLPADRRPPADVAAHLAAWYGPEAAALWDFAERRSLNTWIGTDSAVLAAECAWAVETAHAVRLADVVLRRTRLGGAARPDDHAIAAVADIMSNLLGWSPEQRQAEIHATLARYER